MSGDPAIDLAPYRLSVESIRGGEDGFFIAIHGVLFCSTLIGGDAIDQQAIMYCVGAIALASLSISYSLFTRISRIQMTPPERVS